jgi:hypothetical protein
MRRFSFRETVGLAVGARACLLLGALATASVCATPQPAGVIMVDTVPGEGRVERAEPALPPTPTDPAQPIVLSERLEPVRGGDQMLPPYHGPNPCKMALTGHSPVAKACSDGGTQKALQMMQTFIRRSKAQGIIFQCIDCHPDDDDYSKLAPGADDEFRKLLFLARPAD